MTHDAMATHRISTHLRHSASRVFDRLAAMGLAAVGAHYYDSRDICDAVDHGVGMVDWTDAGVDGV